MTITYQFVCDWDEDGFLCRDARPTDAPNLLTGASGIQSLKRQVVGGSVTALSNIFTLNPYGLAYLEWTTGTDISSFINIGTDGSTYDLSASAGLNYSGVVWVYNTDAAYNAIPVTLELHNQAGTVIAAGSPTTLPNGVWTRLAVTGTSPVGTTALYLRLTRSGTDSGIFNVSGAMIVSGTAPTAFNNGSASLYENFTGLVQEAGWQLGCREPFGYISDREGATVLVRNDDREFSPEYSDSPLYGKLRPEKLVQILATPPDGVRRVLFTGWIASVRPALDGQKSCVMELRGTQQFVDGVSVHLPLLQNVTAEVVAAAVIAQTDIPEDYTIDASVPPGANVEFNVVYPFAADNWTDGVDALYALIDIAKARQGKIVFDREGFYGFWTPRQLAGDSGADITFDNNMIALDYRYGENIINEVIALSYKRKITASDDIVLWEADEEITLEAGETLNIRARYENENDNATVGGANVTLDITAPAAVTSFIQDDAQSALITLNNTGVIPAVVTGLILRGQKLTAFNEVEVTARDEDSIETYGKLVERIESRLVNAKREAQRLASYRLARFKHPVGLAYSVSFIANDTEALENVAVTYGIAWDTVYRVRVVEGQTGHDRVYALIGEQHHLKDGLHRVTWFLEAAASVITLNDSLFGLVGEQRIGLY